MDIPGRPEVYLTGIRNAFGEPRELSDIGQLGADPKKLSAFEKVGFRTYLRTGESPAQLSSKAMEAVLAAASVPAGDIQYVLYCCEFNHGPVYYREIHRACDRLGLRNAYPIGVYLTGCGNFAAGIKLGSGLIASGQAENIMLVAVQCVENDSMRLQQPAVAVLSDAASACILTRNPDGPCFQVGHTELHARHGMGGLDPERDFLRYNMENYKGRIEARERFTRGAGIAPDGFSAIITANYGEPTLLGFASELKVGIEKLYRKNVARYGHAGAADNLINLSDYLDAPGWEAGREILMMTTGPYSWGLTALTEI